MLTITSAISFQASAEALQENQIKSKQTLALSVEEVLGEFCNVQEQKAEINLEGDGGKPITNCGNPITIYGCNGVQFQSVIACDYYGAMINLVLFLAAQETCLT